MYGYQELFERELEKLHQPSFLCPLIIEQKLADIGITLTTKQHKLLEAHFDKLDDDSFNFTLTDDQVANTTTANEAELKSQLQEIFDNLPRNIELFFENIDDIMADVIRTITRGLADEILVELKRKAPSMLKQEYALQTRYAKDLYSTWETAIDHLQTYIVMTFEGSQAYLKQITESKTPDRVFEALILFHAKACQVTREILNLLQHGYADGAQARWRSLHEIAVLACFISAHGNDTAERFILHEHVESYRAAENYNKYYTRLGAEPISDADIAILKQRHDSLLDRFGKEYRNNYGWASHILGKQRPLFADIEQSVALDHMRPYYKAASDNVHANPKGVLYRLGMLPEENAVLAGPSHIGLSDPATCTVISLNQVTVTLLTHKPSVDSLVMCNILATFSKDVQSAFRTIENLVARDA